MEEEIEGKGVLWRKKERKNFGRRNKKQIMKEKAKEK